MFPLSWSFHGRFSANSLHISPRMDHKWNTNSSWTHYVIWASPDIFPHETKLTGGLKCWHVIPFLAINFLVTQNTKFAITLLEKLPKNIRFIWVLLKPRTLEQTTRRWLNGLYWYLKGILEIKTAKSKSANESICSWRIKRF